MSAANIFSISYGGVDVGGATYFQLHNPYHIEKSYEGFRMSFAVVITAPTHEELQLRSDSLETTFRRRLTYGDKLLINLNGSAWTYTVGQNLLKVIATIAKSADPASDKSFSRLYTVTISAELPADNFYDNGLRNIDVLVDNSASNQTTVTARGTFTATANADAVTNYTNRADAEIAHYLTFIEPAAIFELVKEDYSADRERTGGTTPFPHLCNFTRQYVQLLAPQNITLGANWDDPEIRDHRITYSESASFPGDSVARLDRLRRVTGTYDCAVNSAVQTNLQGVFTNKIRATVLALFQGDFSPRVYCVEDFRTSYDETQKRIAATFTFLYQTARSRPTIEVAYSVAYKETRTLDRTPTHQADELSAYVDPGWTVLSRIFTRHVKVVGSESPKLRLTQSPDAGDAGLFVDTVTDESGPDNRPGTSVNQSGWNTIDNSSEATPGYIGDPTQGTQLAVCELVEQVIEQFNRAPQRTLTRTGGGGVATPR